MDIEKYNQTLADLTAPGQPFALDRVRIAGVEYRNYAAAPANLGAYFAAMQGHGDKDFLVHRDTRYSFADTYHRSAALAAALIEDFGVLPGDRIAILSANNPEWIMALIAAVSIGAVAVPMNAWWTSEELDYGIADCGASVVFADGKRLQRLAPIASKYDLRAIAIGEPPEVDMPLTAAGALVEAHAGAPMPAVTVAPDDDATIMYTSGSTGHPKGAVSSHRAILATLYSWMLMGLAQKAADGGTGGDPSLQPAGLLTIPLFHCTASHSVLMMSIPIGRKLVIMDRWDAQEALRLIEAERITWFNGVPTMSAELQAAAAASDRDISSLAEIMAGGAARPPDQVGKLDKTFSRSSPGIGYGLTETNALGTVNAGDLYRARPGSAGRVVPAVTELQIVDEKGQSLPAGERGEVCIKSPANVRGYWNKPEATAEAFVDGWFHTGDIGYLDEDGFLYVVDRIKDIIIRGGENISCLEVEAAIHLHPAVAEVAVFGLPEERLGEQVGAAVVLRPGQTLDKDELLAFLEPHLAAFKMPVQVWFRDAALPRIASGKIFKRQLKAEYGAKLAAAARGA